MAKDHFRAAATEAGTRTQFGANGEIVRGLSPTFGIVASAGVSIAHSNNDHSYDSATSYDPFSIT